METDRSDDEDEGPGAIAAKPTPEETVDNSNRPLVARLGVPLVNDSHEGSSPAAFRPTPLAKKSQYGCVSI